MKIYVIKILQNNFQILSGKIGRNFSHSGKLSGRNIERNFCQNWKETAKFRQNWKEISFFLTLILHPVMRVQNISWKSHPTKVYIYNTLPPVSSLVQSRRVRFAGHCCRAEKEVISDLLLWKPFSRKKIGRKLTYPDVISIEM